jgi:ubiquinone/menaquinone biosynthesis C-methylase UbiE
MNTPDQIKHEVRNHYTKVVNTSSSCCGSACGCSADFTFAESYAGREGYVPDADLGLGCGIPTDVAALKPGETVVDLGSGAGNDCFVAQRIVGPTGRVIGVDFTPAMIRKAQENAAKLGVTNVEFVRGEIEQLPLDNGLADVIVSNCVLNLVPDKKAAFVEMCRVLKPGGRFAVSDMVVEGDLPDHVRSVAALYGACVGGAVRRHEYLDWLRESGFADVAVQKEKPYELSDDFLSHHLSTEQIAQFRATGAKIVSITVSGTKPS